MRSVAPVLIVEDDAVLSRTVCDALIDEGYVVLAVSTAEAARSMLQRSRPSVLVLDLTLPDCFGGDLLAELAETADPPPTVILSTFHLAAMIANRYNVELVSKPFEMDALLAAVRRAQDQQLRPALGVVSG